MDDDTDGVKRRTSERIAEVRARFASGLGQRAEALSALARGAASADRSVADKAADDLRLGLHNLAGGAPTLGLADLGKAAAALEKRLIAERLADGGLELSVAERLAGDIERLPDLA
ncbi:Hpt domain-containing protein [Chenggangzhangella methanolivorans]|uniref:Hpt domain-containing protein n=1 Tax=Chenggangzhangella methanolivorans TaxID=1437009 RepID=A0A9E6ULX6_9HYPH|nr:Hpt domain-containing protein [Chenggangzhangella methanolivorans]QZN99460.1 Hpt domain-containing protein [Chenggangzhangella methanolivorans]